MKLLRCVEYFRRKKFTTTLRIKGEAAQATGLLHSIATLVIEQIIYSLLLLCKHQAPAFLQSYVQQLAGDNRTNLIQESIS